MSLYVYCLCEEPDAEAFTGAVGVGGAAVSVLRLGRVAAVLSEIEDKSVAATGENATAHNRINSLALDKTTPLPFRFGTRVAEAQIAKYVAANEEALVAALARVRGCVEMGVKIRLSEIEDEGTKAEDGSAQADESGAGSRLDDVAARDGSGTAFLLAKQREIFGDEASRLRAEELATWLAGGVSGLVRASAARVNPSESLVVRAAHLVERVGVAKYRERVRRLSLQRTGLQFLTSGPWPPYSFSDIERR